MKDNILIIVRSNYLDLDQARKAASKLFWDFNINAEESQKVLLNRGFGYLEQQEWENATKISDILESYGYEVWTIIEPDYDIELLHASKIKVFSDHIDFYDKNSGHITIGKQDTVIAVLADVESEHLYEYSLSLNEKYNFILKGNHPVLDFYILSNVLSNVLSEGKVVKGAVRIDLYNSHKSKQKPINYYHTIILKVAKYSGEFYFSFDFPFSRFPGCCYNLYDKSADNIASLTKYGFFLCAMHACSELVVEKIEDYTLFSLIDLSFDLKQEQIKTEPLNKVDSENKDRLNIFDQNIAMPHSDIFEPNRNLPPPPCFDQQRSFILSKTNIILFVLGFCVLKIAFSSGFIKIAFEFILSHSWLLAGILILISLTFFIFSIYYFNLNLILKDIPTSKTRSAAMGIVELKGRAVRKYSLVSPISQAPCVYYKISKYRSNNQSRWICYKRLESGPVPFYLKDDTGQILINPDKARFDKVCKQEYRGLIMLIPYAVPIPIPNNEKWIEEIIYENLPLYVLGNASPLNYNFSIKERLIEKIRVFKKDNSNIKKYDKDGDGMLNTVEWDRAKSDMEKEIIKDELEKDNNKKEYLVIKKPDMGGIPFIISQTSDDVNLNNYYKIISCGYLIASAAIGFWAIITVMR